MSFKAVLYSLFLVMCLPVPLAVGSYATIHTSAGWGSSLSDSAEDSTGSADLSAEGFALADGGPNEYAAGDATACIDGREGVGGMAEGFSASGNFARASGTAVSSADWRIRSDTLPVGTPVQIGLEVKVQGSLYSEAAGWVSSAEISLLCNGWLYYGGTASYDYSSGLEADGSWIYGLYPAGDTEYIVYDFGSFEIDSAVGEIIHLTLTLRTEIEHIGTLAGGARADFSDSLSYHFTNFLEPGTNQPADADPVLIPEPAAVVLLSVGGLLLRMRS